MRKVALKMSVSVDGFVEGPNGKVDWLFKSRDEDATTVTDGVRRALGREPGDCADYARDTATPGVWGTQR